MSTPTLAPSFVELEDARAYVLRDPLDASQDALFGVLIPAYSQAAQDYCDRTFIYEMGVARVFRLRMGARFLSLTPYEVQPDTITLDPEVEYVGDPPHLSSLGTYLALELPFATAEFITITADYGPMELPAAVKLAVLKAIDNDYRNPSGHGTQALGPYSYSEAAEVASDSTFSLPRASRNLLNPYRRWA